MVAGFRGSRTEVCFNLRWSDGRPKSKEGGTMRGGEYSDPDAASFRTQMMDSKSTANTMIAGGAGVRRVVGLVDVLPQDRAGAPCILPAQCPHRRRGPPSPESTRLQPNRPASKRSFERATALRTSFVDYEAALHPVAEATGPANKRPARPSGPRCAREQERSTEEFRG